MDTKKIVVIIAGIVVLLSIVLVVILNPFKKDESKIDDTTLSQIDQKEQELNDEAASMPDLTDEQNKTFDEIVGNVDIGDIEIISTPDDQDLENEDPALVYKDGEGNIIKEEMSIEDWNMTDEEAEEEMERIYVEMDQMIKDYDKDKAAWETSGGNSNPNNNSNVKDAPTVEENEKQFTDSGDKFDYYDGYGSYNAMIDAYCKFYPELSREEIIQRNPDPAGFQVNEAAARADEAEDRLTGGQ